jgi:hypothetical protein
MDTCQQGCNQKGRFCSAGAGSTCQVADTTNELHKQTAPKAARPGTKEAGARRVENGLLTTPSNEPQQKSWKLSARCWVLWCAHGTSTEVETTRVAYVMMDEENDDGRGLGGPEEQTEAKETHPEAQR